MPGGKMKASKEITKPIILNSLATMGMNFISKSEPTVSAQTEAA
jgi:hypothetical protein